MLTEATRLVLAAFVLIGISAARHPADAASYRVLYSFKGGSDGAAPVAKLVSLGGLLYGTTQAGGTNGAGTVFAIDPATGAETVIHSFGAGSDGATPLSGLVVRGGRLYGTTLQGGAGYGVIYSITPAGIEKVLYAFQGDADGAHPHADMINVARTLYGTTSEGGSAGCGGPGCGTVFSFVPASGSERVLHAFTDTEGADPLAPLLNINGTLFGTSNGGGSAHYGSVFAVDSTTGATRVLHSFVRDGTDGYNPYGGLVAVGTRLFGTTVNGGATPACDPAPATVAFGCGTVFSLDRVSGAYKVVRALQGGPADAEYPEAAFAKLGGLLYGTSVNGGSMFGGALFSIDPKTGAEAVVHSFSIGDGVGCAASLLTVGGTLYGTTYDGGDHAKGTVFAFTP